MSQTPSPDEAALLSERANSDRESAAEGILEELDSETKGLNSEGVEVLQAPRADNDAVESEADETSQLSPDDGQVSIDGAQSLTDGETDNNEAEGNPEILTRDASQSGALRCGDGTFYGIGRTSGKVYRMTGDGHPPTVAEETGIVLRNGATENGLGIGLNGQIAYSYSRPAFMDIGDSLRIHRWDAKSNKTVEVWGTGIGGFDHFPQDLTNGRVRTGQFYAGAVAPDSAEFYFGGHAARRNTSDPESERDRLFDELRGTEHDYGGPSIDAYLWSAETVIYRYVPSGDPLAANPSGRVEKVGTVRMDNYIGRLGVSSLDDTNGDFAFDKDGNLIILYSNSDRGRMRVAVVPKETLEANLAKPESERGRMDVPYTKVHLINKGYRPNGLAIATDGALIQSWSTGTVGQNYITRLDPVTGELLEPEHMEGNQISGARWSDVITDLASCNSSFPRLTVDKEFKDRADSSDQVGLGVNSENNLHGRYAFVQTAGAATGVQPQKIHPMPIRSGQSYYISETLLGKSTLDDYHTSFSCSIKGHEDQPLSVQQVQPHHSEGGRTDASLMYRLDVPANLSAQYSDPLIQCRFVNSTEPEEENPKLTLVKEIAEPSYDPDANANQWTLTATGPDTISGLTGETTVTAAEVAEGEYVLTEALVDAHSAKAPGYELESLVCVDNAANPASSIRLTGAEANTLTLESGQDVTCTFTNKTLPAKITWTKVDEADTDARLKGSEWKLTGPSHTAGTTIAGDQYELENGVFTVNDLVWGEYTLEETKAPAGYVRDSEKREVTVGAAHVTDPLKVGDITNAKKETPSLPLTGGISRDFYIITGLLGVLFGVAAVVISRRFNGRKEAL